MSYYLAPSLVRLRDEINRLFPKRDKSSDGWVGDTSHQAKKSDHNPDWADGGVVRAIDVDIDGNKPGSNLVEVLLKAVVGDPRVWYVIFNGKIYSRTNGWKAKKYTGSNKHTKHVHISLVHTRAAETSKAAWISTPAPAPIVKPWPTIAPEVSLTVLKAQFALSLAGKPVTPNSSVLRLQHALNARYKAGLATDGAVGPATIRAWGAHVKHIGKRGALLGSPDVYTLKRLTGSWYRVTVQGGK